MITEKEYDYILQDVDVWGIMDRLSDLVANAECYGWSYCDSDDLQQLDDILTRLNEVATGKYNGNKKSNNNISKTR